MKRSIETAEELARIGKENELAEIEYEDDAVKIRLCFDPPVTAAPATLDPSMFVNLQSGTPAVASNGTVHDSSPAEASPATQGETINSPLAGVFYRSPRPDAPPFVEESTSVSAGQTLCIVEAMKLMNEITADRGCNIVKILVGNAEAVEEGQPLFVIA